MKIIENRFLLQPDSKFESGKVFYGYDYTPKYRHSVSKSSIATSSKVTDLGTSLESTFHQN